MFPEILKQNEKLLEILYTDLAQPGVKKVGQALESVLGLLTTASIPLRLINERANTVAEKNMRRYKEKIDAIDSEKIAVVPLELGVPIVTNLSYTTNELISEMFINLLARASSIDTSNLAHPGFIQLISNLSVDEAKIISYFLERDMKVVSYIFFQADAYNNYTSYRTSDRLCGLEKEVDLLYPENIYFYLDNLTKLGILSNPETNYPVSEEERLGNLVLTYEDEFKVFQKELEHREVAGQEIKYSAPYIVKGSYIITNYGQMFMYACAARLNI